MKATYVLPNWAHDLCAGLMPRLNEPVTSYHGDDTWHVMGSTFTHPDRHLVVCLAIVKHTKRNKVPMYVSFNEHGKPLRQRSRNRYVNGEAEYGLYIIDAHAATVTKVDSFHTLGTARQALRDHVVYWKRLEREKAKAPPAPPVWMGRQPEATPLRTRPWVTQIRLEPMPETPPARAYPVNGASPNGGMRPFKRYRSLTIPDKSD